MLRNSIHARSCATQIFVVLAWAGMIIASIYSFGQLKLGLEQQLVLPTGSYLTPYFDQQATLGDAGPPVYIVLQNVNYTNVANVSQCSPSCPCRCCCSHPLTSLRVGARLSFCRLPRASSRSWSLCRRRT